MMAEICRESKTWHTNWNVNKVRTKKSPGKSVVGVTRKIIFIKGKIMRKSNFIRSFFIGLFLFAFVAGCAGTYQKESTGEYIMTAC